MGDGAQPAPRGPGRGLDGIDAMLGGLVLIWGTAFAVIPILEQPRGPLDPFQLSWYRYAPFPLLYGAYFLWRRPAWRAVAGLDWVRMAILGFVGVVGYHFALNWGMSDLGGPAVPAATGAILVATTPLWTMFLAVASRRERFNAMAAAGTVLAFAGVATVVSTSQADPGQSLRLAGKAAIVIAAPLSWAVYSVYSKPLIARYGGPFVTGTTLSLGTFTLLPLGVSYGVAPLARLDAVGWAGLLFLALLSTALGYAMWNHALRHRAASSVAAYIYLNPVVATVAALVLAHVPALGVVAPRLTWPFLAGGAAVLAGVILVNQARLRAAASANAVAAQPAKS